MAAIEICYAGDGKYRQADFVDLPSILQHHQAFVWIDADGDQPEELRHLQAHFGLHQLAVDSALEGQQRSRIMLYDDMIYLEFYGLRLEDDVVSMDDIGIFVGEKFIITVRRGKHPDLEPVLTRWRDEMTDTKDAENTNHTRIPGIAKQARREPSSTMMLYAILDELVDAYFPVVEWFGETIEEFENQVMESSRRNHQREVQRLRMELLALRRQLAPEQELLNTLLRRDVPVIDEEMLPYFADVHDHVLRIHDWLESYRDQLSTIVDLQLSMQSNNLNQTMRTMTASSIILMVCALITGFYGMNFTHFPSLHWRYGLEFSIVLMLVSSLGLLVVFRAHDWW